MDSLLNFQRFRKKTWSQEIIKNRVRLLCSSHSKLIRVFGATKSTLFLLKNKVISWALENFFQAYILLLVPTWILSKRHYSKFTHRKVVSIQKRICFYNLFVVLTDKIFLGLWKKEEKIPRIFKIIMLPLTLSLMRLLMPIILGQLRL